MSSPRVPAVAFCIGLVFIARACDEGPDASPALLEETRGHWTLPERPRLDRYGNEVERAVGDYRLDELGDMFELHSPDTELPRIPRPET